MASESLTKLYFAIFAAFKESITLNLAQRSFKVIEIIFAEFQPIMITTPQRYRPTDRQTTCLGNTALRVVSRGKNACKRDKNVTLVKKRRAVAAQTARSRCKVLFHIVGLN